MWSFILKQSGACLTAEPLCNQRNLLMSMSLFTFKGPIMTDAEREMSLLLDLILFQEFLKSQS